MKFVMWHQPLKYSGFPEVELEYIGRVTTQFAKNMHAILNKATNSVVLRCEDGSCPDGGPRIINRFEPTSTIRVLCRVVDVEEASSVKDDNVNVFIPSFISNIDVPRYLFPKPLVDHLVSGLRFHAMAHFLSEQVIYLSDFEFSGTIQEQSKIVEDARQEIMEQLADELPEDIEMLAARARCKLNTPRRSMHTNLSFDFNINQIDCLDPQALEAAIKQRLSKCSDGRYSLQIEMLNKALYELIKVAAEDAIESEMQQKFKNEAIMVKDNTKISRWSLEAEEMKKALQIYYSEHDNLKIKVS